MNQKKYYIVGAGRCGSHWIETILRERFGEGNVIHTHDRSLLKEIPAEHRDDTVIVVCRRKDRFQTAISHAVAYHTDEWFFYTDKFVRPFDVHPNWFRGKLYDLDVWYYHFDIDIRPLFSNIIDVWYEDLKNYTNDPALFVAKKLNIEYAPITAREENRSKKNPRDYRKLIRNWEELERVNAQYKFRYRTPGT